MRKSNGRQPDARRRIQEALEAYAKYQATPEQLAMFKDWKVMVTATKEQAIYFQSLYQGRKEDPEIVDMFFQVLAVRSEQNSVAAKAAKRQARAAASIESDPEPSPEAAH
jgi:hypothetical protein